MGIFGGVCGAGHKEVGRGRLKVLFTLALGTGMSSVVGGQTVYVETNSGVRPEGSVCVEVDNRARVDTGTMKRASEQASRILMAAGVPIKWNTRSEGGVVRKTESEDCVVVTVLPKPATHISAEALGFAKPHGVDGGEVTIFSDRIEGLPYWQNTSGANVSKILGSVMAHEIGHVLLGSPDHSPTGIMNGHWGTTEFWTLTHRGLKFTNEQGALMRESVSRRAALHHPELDSAATLSEVKREGKEVKGRR